MVGLGGKGEDAAGDGLVTAGTDIAELLDVMQLAVGVASVLAVARAGHRFLAGEADKVLRMPDSVHRSDRAANDGLVTRAAGLA